MEEGKVEAIKKWDPPTKVIELRSFVGLVNYYSRFIKGYFTRASPLTDLFKKNRTWEWTSRCQEAFNDLKTTVMEEPANLVADALSRKSEISAITQVQGELLDIIREGMEHNSLAKNLVNIVKEEKTKRFWVEDGLLCTIR
ncbi:uncharacterized mitochondrial protein AtMg00860-like [Carya illinoinensis]|uniref:uncharacterized mitochondrial protein AtMg00860-like n=1 Tax=Carya illinoinensis TaxID=32201 RepID=UPI001C7216E2|nr:uncharacterized mitochondrial protein AtMg00860-like [Carya illinoinensis]